MRRVLYFALIALVLLIAGLVSYRKMELTGLVGFGAGALLGLSLCALSHVFLKLARAAEGHSIVRAVMSGVIVSFGVLIASVLAVRWAWPEIVHPFALTALGVYLMHRFYEALEPMLASGRPASGGTSDSPVSTAAEEPDADD